MVAFYLDIYALSLVVPLSEKPSRYCITDAENTGLPILFYR